MPKTFAERLDAAETGEKFGEVLKQMLDVLHDYVYEDEDE